MKYAFLVYLLVISIVDIWTRKVPALWIYGGTVGMTFYGMLQLSQGKRTFLDLLCALLPGMLCYLFAKVSKAMGEGDAWIIGQLGLVFSRIFTLRIVVLSFFLAACGAIVFMLVRRTIKNSKVPFLPCIFLATVFHLVG